MLGDQMAHAAIGCGLRHRRLELVVFVGELRKFVVVRFAVVGESVLILSEGADDAARARPPLSKRARANCARAPFGSLLLKSEYLFSE